MEKTSNKVIEFLSCNDYFDIDADWSRLRRSIFKTQSVIWLKKRDSTFYDTSYYVRTCKCVLHLWKSRPRPEIIFEQIQSALPDLIHIEYRERYDETEEISNHEDEYLDRIDLYINPQHISTFINIPSDNGDKISLYFDDGSFLTLIPKNKTSKQIYKEIQGAFKEEYISNQLS